MSEGTMGDDVYQPDPGEDQLDDSGQLDSEDTLLNRGVADSLDEGYSPPEHPLGAEHYGITADEQHRGESLDQRLAEEVPEVPSGEDDGDDDLGDASDTDGELRDGEVGGSRSGRLVAPGEGAHDEHDGMVASDIGIDGSAASAEEAAMHLIPDAED
jgi:hypothetical protein